MGVSGRVQFWSIPGAFVPVQECGWDSNSKEVMMAGVGCPTQSCQCVCTMFMVKSHVDYPKSLMDTSPKERDTSGRRSPLGFSIGSGSSPSVWPSSAPGSHSSGWKRCCLCVGTHLGFSFVDQVRLSVKANSKDTVSRCHKGMAGFGKN